MKSYFNLYLAALFMCCSCQKINTPPPAKAEAKIDTTSSINRLNNTPDSTVTRSKAVNSVTCAKSNVAWGYSVAYTIIGRFPPTTTSPSVVLAKTTWFSPNGAYRLVNQQDGNLVLYQGSGTNSLWGSANTFNKTTRFQLQGDINFVAYQGNSALWASGTQPYRCVSSTNKLPQNLMLILTDQGELEMIADGFNEFGVPVTVSLAGTRTSGGVHSPNNGSFFMLYDRTDLPQYSFYY